MSSIHLDAILSEKNRVANTQIVFCDVAKYSQRRTTMQAAVIDAFTKCCNAALLEAAKDHVDYFQKNDLNLSRDAIVIPTGDGAAFAFTFDGLHDIHLSFAKTVLRLIAQHNDRGKCSKYEEQGWCNCHDYFAVRIGISDGKCIVYRDINQHYNVAGGVINFAARVMSKADANQIVLTEEAYRSLIDLMDDPHLDEKFRVYKDIRVKHGISLTLYQYIGDEPYVNKEEPSDLMFHARFTAMQEQMKASGMSMMPDMAGTPDKKQLLQLMDGLGKVVEGFSAMTGPKSEEPAKRIESRTVESERSPTSKNRKKRR